MKNISTGFGLCVAAAAALAYPFVSSLAPSANASVATAAASAVSTAATAQTGPTIVWYGTTSAFSNYLGSSVVVERPVVFRAWSDGRLEMCRISGGELGNWCSQSLADAPCVSMWYVISDPAQGLTYRSDINFDEQVDGADLGQLLADWGNAPRQDIPPSDCPMALINP
jgi:hypothetical protein